MQTKNYFLNCHSEESIKIRFRQLAVKLHPDKNPNDPNATKVFQEFEDQRDKAIRKIYKDSGLTEKQINQKVENFVSDLWKDPSIILNNEKMTSLGNSLAPEVMEKFGDNPKFSDVFKFVLDKLTGASKVIDQGKSNNQKNLNP